MKNKLVLMGLTALSLCCNIHSESVLIMNKTDQTIALSEGTIDQPSGSGTLKKNEDALIPLANLGVVVGIPSVKESYIEISPKILLQKDAQCKGGIIDITVTKAKLKNQLNVSISCQPK